MPIFKALVLIIINYVYLKYLALKWIYFINERRNTNERDIIVNIDLIDYLMKNIRLISECDIQEKAHSFPYTRSVSNFFQKIKFEYDIDFDEELISEKLLAKMIDEIENSLPR